MRNLTMLYNEKTGDVIAQTPDGQTISTQGGEKPKK